MLFTRADVFESERVYEGVIVNLRVDKLRKSNGTEALRELVEHNGGVVVACQPEDDQVVLIRQYRYSVDEEIYELPAGRIEIGEDPFLAAKRELTEETGYTANEWSELVRMYSAPGFCNEILYLYRAADVTLNERRLDYDEDLEVLVFNLDEAWNMALTGKIRDAKTIAGIALLMNKR